MAWLEEHVNEIFGQVDGDHMDLADGGAELFCFISFVIFGHGWME